MSRLRGLDLAIVVAENAGCPLRSTIENGDEIIHSFAMRGPVGHIFIAAKKDSLNHCWIGQDVGVFPLAARLVDAVDADQGSPGRVHGVIGDGQVTLQIRSLMRPDELSVFSFMRLVDVNFRQSLRLRQRILGTMPPSPKLEKQEGSPTSVPSVAETIVSGFLSEWRRILRHGGHRTNLGIPTSRAWDDVDGGRMIDSYTVNGTGWYQAGSAPWALLESSDMSEVLKALEVASPPDFVALRELDGKILVCGAIGAITFAVEDDADLTRAVAMAVGASASPSVVDMVSGYFDVATKASYAFGWRGRFPGEGWPRPLSVWVSSARKEVRIKTRRATHEMVVDADITRAATALLIDPDYLDARDRLGSELGNWFTAAESRGSR